MWVRLSACVCAVAVAIAGAASASAGGHHATTAASAPRAAGAAGCTTAAASQAATAAGFGVDPISKRTPINSVVCGPFFGSGSQGMAATVAVPTGCGFSIGWGVFRLDNGSWHLVMKQDNGAFLESAPLADGGADIRTTRGYPRRNDPACSPSRWQTQVWHWNGTAFVASPWIVPLTSFDFSAPRRTIANAVCSMNDWPTLHNVSCATDTPPHRVGMNGNGGLKVCRGFGQSCISCGCAPRVRVLAYGHRADVGRFRCESLQAGVRCTVLKTRKGFLFTRRTTVRVG